MSLEYRRRQKGLNSGFVLIVVLVVIMVMMLSNESVQGIASGAVGAGDADRCGARVVLLDATFSDGLVFA